MARLFIRHQPIACVVDPSIEDGVFYIDPWILPDNKLSASQNSTDFAYICFVHEGVCWAARNSLVMGNKQLRIACMRMEDQPCVQEMLLADLILN